MQRVLPAPLADVVSALSYELFAPSMEASAVVQSLSTDYPVDAYVARDPNDQRAYTLSTTADRTTILATLTLIASRTGTTLDFAMRPDVVEHPEHGSRLPVEVDHWMEAIESSAQALHGKPPLITADWLDGVDLDPSLADLDSGFDIS